ncbi:MAG: homocysteine S-methyltransferase family protein [Gammaproteobacteria bacterium]|nr:homocysteine S-methyltransferase family protein [Gammaproteobacteria bacterium]
MPVVHPCGPPWLEQKLGAGETIIIDGAMGTELQARDVAMHPQVWSATAAFSDPEKVQAAHGDYIRAGAQVIIANTFACGRHMLEPAGLGDIVGGLNARAVQLAGRARDESAQQPVAVAGSICEWVRADSGWTTSQLRDSFEEQTELLARCGVDLLVVEMAQHPQHSPMAVAAALQTGLPVWAGLSCRRDGEALVGFDAPHHPFDAIVASVAGLDIGLISVMHSPIANTRDALAAVRSQWSGPLGAYPESGHFKMPDWQFIDIIAPPDLVEEARVWVADGVQVVGGCCGLSVPHIAALKHALA